MDDNEYIAQRLEQQHKWYSSKSQHYQAWHKRLQIIQLVAATCIPFLSTYATDETAWLRIVIGILGLGIAVIAGLLALYKFEEKWIKYRTTAESLKHEKYRYLTHTIPYDGEDAFALLVQRVESLISQENRDWSQYVGTQAEKIDQQ